MTVKTKEELKAYFQNGKVPSQSHYSDLMDTIFSLVTEFPGIANQFLNGLGQFVQVNWGDVSGKPTSFTPSVHSHSGSDITSGTISTDRFSAYSDLSAESKIGSGSTQVASGNHTHSYAPVSHNHDASQIVSGVLPTDRQKAYGCRVINAFGQNIPNSTWTPVSFTTEVYDTDNCWSPVTPTVLKATRSGYYLGGGNCYIDTLNSNIWSFLVGIRINGYRFISIDRIMNGSIVELGITTMTGMFYLTANDYIEIMVYHNSGANKTLKVADYDNQHKALGWLTFIGV